MNRSQCFTLTVYNFDIKETKLSYDSDISFECETDVEENVEFIERIEEMKKYRIVLLFGCQGY